MIATRAAKSRWIGAGVLATCLCLGTAATGGVPERPSPRPASLLAPPGSEPPSDRVLAVSALTPALEAGRISPDELDAAFRAGGLPAALELAGRLPALGDCILPDNIDGPVVPDSLDVLHYTIEILEVDEAAERVRAVTTVQVALLGPPDAPARAYDGFDLDMSTRLVVTGVELEEGGTFHPVPFTHVDDLLHIGPITSILGAPPLPGPPAPFRVRIHYESTASECTSSNGIPSGFAFNQLGVHTFSEPTFARHWYPCHDVPRDKATVTLRVTVPDGRAASASGLLAGDEMIDGKRVLTWEHTDPVSTYLVAFYLSDYVKLDAVGPGGLPLEYFVTPEKVAVAPTDFAHVPDMIEFFSAIHPYPYPRYAMTLGWFGGGMEHVMNSLIGVFFVTGDRSNETLYVHELAHQWWGDLLTPATWRDIWLNEGFARFSEWIYFEHRYGWEAMADLRAVTDTVYMDPTGKWRESRPELDHPILDAPPDNLFSFVIYNKGGRVVDMLRGVSRLRLMQGGPPRTPEALEPLALQGDERFFAVLRDYAAAHRFGSVSSADFQAAAERGLGEDLSWYFDPWLHGTSFPHLRVDWTNTEAPGRTFLSVRLRQTEGPQVPMPVHIRYRSGDRVLDEVRELRPALDWVVELPPGTWEVVLDPEDWLLDLHEAAPVSPRGLPLAVQPNPSYSGFDIVATLPGSAAAPVGMDVFDVQGRRVRSLDGGVQNPGPVSMRWDGMRDDGRRAPAGAYFARLRLGSERAVARLVLLP